MLYRNMAPFLWLPSQGPSGAANKALSPAQNCRETMEKKEICLCMNSNMYEQFLSYDHSFECFYALQCVDFMRDIQTDLSCTVD